MQILLVLMGFFLIIMLTALAGYYIKTKGDMTLAAMKIEEVIGKGIILCCNDAVSVLRDALKGAKDSSRDAGMKGFVSSKIDEVSSDIRDIKTDQAAIHDRFNSLIERLEQAS